MQTPLGGLPGQAEADGPKLGGELTDGLDGLDERLVQEGHGLVCGQGGPAQTRRAATRPSCSSCAGSRSPAPSSRAAATSSINAR